MYEPSTQSSNSSTLAMLKVYPGQYRSSYIECGLFDMHVEFYKMGIEASYVSAIVALL